MLTKFMRYAPYEDYLIKKYDKGFEGIKNSLLEEKIKYIIKINKKKDGDFTTYLIKNMTSSQEINFFNIKIQRIPFMDYSYMDNHYSIFQIE